MGLVWQLAWRFRQGKRQNGFISFISASSTLGIGLGCFVLILLLSVMNGFEKELKNRLLSLIPHGEIWSVSPQGIRNWQAYMPQFAADPDIVDVEPYSKATGMLQKGKNMKAVELTAISPEYDGHTSLVQSIPADQWQAFQHHQQGVILGKGVMKALELEPGDKVQLLLPQMSNDMQLKAPKTVWLTVLGEVSIGGELDNHIGFMHLQEAAEAMDITYGAQGFKFTFKDPYMAPELIRKIGYDFEQQVYISSWTRTQGHLYQDIQLVRTVVYLALTLLIAVACFNIVSTLVMAVNEKQGEVAMLKTMGARNHMIISVFMLQGLINGLWGTLCGVALGIVVADNLTAIVTGVENLLGIRLLSGDIYFIDFLPSDLQFNDVYLTAGIALLLSLLATIYPAIKATKIKPAEVLGH